MVPVYVEAMVKLVTVTSVSMVQFLVLVLSKTTSSADVGRVLALQLFWVLQLLSEPPPSHVRVVASAREATPSGPTIAMTRAARTSPLDQVTVPSPLRKPRSRPSTRARPH